MNASRPTNETLNSLATSYRDLQAKIADLEEQISPIRKHLIGLVKTCGSLSPRSEKTTRLDTPEFTIKITQSASLTVDKVGIAKLQASLARAGCPALFKKLFRREELYIPVVSSADVTSGKLKLPENAPRNLRERFFAAFKFDLLPPQLTVQPKEKDEIEKGGSE